VVYNEADGNTQGDLPDLILDAYDILRVCEEHPNRYIPDRKIRLPLASLRKMFAAHVRKQRKPPPSDPVKDTRIDEAKKYPKPPAHERSRLEGPQPKKRKVGE